MPDDSDRGSFPIRPAPRDGNVEARPLRRRPSDEDAGLPNPDDVKRLNDPAVRRCRNCKKEIYEDTDICYHCGEAQMAGSGRPRLWVVIVIIIMIVAFLWSSIRGFF